MRLGKQIFVSSLVGRRIWYRCPFGGQFIPRVPVDRGKLNNRTTAEASQNKVEVARSHSSRSVAFRTFYSDNSIFSGPNILQIAMNQQQRLCCIVQKQIATPLDISCPLRSTLAGSGSFP
ncbi:conserved hypothetical protein [Trichinella spiralis]|uniref:hypothetical protein n=1 Tax=Trichinella spiralis TaxID=6334 RepID=UPI0001EFBD26|nr:conserved hypothetical protein [Trichinella spiralis]